MVALSAARTRRSETEAGLLLDLTALSPDGVGVLHDGTLMRAVTTGFVNPLVMDTAAVAQLARQLHALNSRVPAGQSLLLYVQSSPLALDRLVARERALNERAVRAADRAGAHARARALRRHGFAELHTLMTHVPGMAATSLRFLALCPWRSPRPLALARDRDRVHEVDAAQLHRDLRAVERYATTVAGVLRGAGLPARHAPGPELLDLLWSRFSPGLADAGSPPPSVTHPYAIGALDAARDEEEAIALAAHLREAICQQPIRPAGPTALAFGDEIPAGPQQLAVPVSLEQTWRVATVPEQTWLGWVMTLMQSSTPWTLAVHIHGSDRHRERSRNRRRYRRLRGLNRGTRMRGRDVDPEQEEREEEAGEVNRLLSRNAGSTIQNVSIYLSLRESTGNADRLADEGAELARELTSTTDAHLDPGRGVQRDAWRSTLPLGRDYLDRGRKYLSINVADTIPLVGTGCGSPMSETWIPVGFSSIGRTLEGLDPFDPEHPNHVWMISGIGGSGKTTFANVLGSRSLPKGAHGTIIERGGHYRTLTLTNPDAVLLQPGASGHALNPWDGEGDDAKVAFLLALHDLVIGDQAGLADASAIAVRTRALLTLAIQGVYTRCGTSGETPREGLLAEELHVRYRRALEDGSGDLAGDYQTLELAIAPYHGKGASAWLLDRETTIPSDTVLEVWDTRHIPDAESPAALFMICEYAVRKVEARRAKYLAGERDGTPWDGKSFLWIDEVWRLFERRSTARRVMEWALRSRHLALWFGVISQRLDHFSSEEGRNLISQSVVKVFLKTSADQLPYIKETVGLSEEEAAAIGSLTTSKREFSQMFVINGSRRGTLTFSVSDLEYWLATSDPVNDEPVRADALRETGGDFWAAARLLASPEWHERRRQQAEAIV